MLDHPPEQLAVTLLAPREPLHGYIRCTGRLLDFLVKGMTTGFFELRADQADTAALTFVNILAIDAAIDHGEAVFDERLRRFSTIAAQPVSVETMGGYQIEGGIYLPAGARLALLAAEGGTVFRPLSRATVRHHGQVIGAEVDVMLNLTRIVRFTEGAAT